MRTKFSLALALSAGLFQLPSLHAQTERPLLATPSVRVTAPLANGALVTLKGNTYPLAQARYDQGAASPSLATGRLTLFLKPSPAQESALQQFMGSLQDPHSPNYHKWLTPAEYGASFGIAEADLQAVEGWLQGQGFKVEAVPASRNIIQFSGTAGQVAQAFHTSIHSYLIDGVHHLSNAVDPQIPAALAPVVAGISPLNDFHPRPQHVLQGRLQKNPVTGEVRRLTGGGAHAEITSTSSSAPFLALGPADAATIYDAPNSMNRNYTGSTQLTGAGVNVGTVNDSDLPVNDYLNYRRTFLNEASPANPNLVIDGVDPGVQNGGDAVEAVLDAELLAGIAPSANLYFYSSASDLFQDGVYDASLRAVEDNNVALLSVSFGLCEADLGSSGNAAWASLWRQAAAQGITVAVSTADSGSAACDDPNSENEATLGLGVSGIASTPYDIAVGGTDFDVLPTSFSQYVSTTPGSPSTPYGADFGTALGYIPENPWNDSISNNPPGSYTTNTATQYSDQGTSFTSISAGSGGFSSAAICPGGNVDPSTGNCLSTINGAPIPGVGYPIPAFQQGTAFANTPLGAGKVRGVPDVALLGAGGAQHQAGWAFCSDNVVNGDTRSTYQDCGPAALNGQFGYGVVGGTSAAAPAFTGMLGLVVQSLGAGKRLGVANQVLYNLASTQYSSVFHDITAGNNSVVCKAGTPNCGSNGFLTGYDAGTGFDLTTGLGSVDVAHLVSAWDSVRFAPSTVSLQVNSGTAAISVQHGTPITLAASVTPSSAMGDVSVTGTNTGQGGAAVVETIPLTSGSGSLAAVKTLPGGSYSLQAYYQGDATDAPSTSGPPIPVTISPEASAPFLSLGICDLANQTACPQNPAPTTVPYGAYGFAYLEPQNVNALSTGVGSHGAATGTVTFSNNSTAIGTQTLDSQGVATFPLYTLVPGTYSFSANYSGDASYNASATTTPLPLTITKGPTTLAVHTGTVSGTSRTLTVELDTDSAGASPTGAVTLSINGKTYTSSSTQNGSIPDGAAAVFGTFTVPTSAFKSSDNRLSATYAGDTNYNASNAGTCTFTPTTASATLDRTPHSTKRFLLAAGSSMTLCSVLFFSIPARRRAWRMILVALFFVSLTGAIGCGSSSSNSGSTNVPLIPTCAK